MGYILGIDQGGTNTRAAVMDTDGNVLGYGRTEGVYFPSSGIKNALQAIAEASAVALDIAGAKIGDVDMIVAGVSGIDWDGDDTLVAGELADFFAVDSIIACNDCEIAYYGGSVRPVGAVLCAGTGANAAYFAPGGKKFVMGDYMKASLQGGSAIARRAADAVFESCIGVIPETALTELFLGHFKDASVHELLRRSMVNPDFPKEITSLVPQIIKTADNGDEAAAGLLSSFSDELCGCFMAGIRKMNMSDIDCDIVLSGSVFKGSANPLTAMIKERLAKSAARAKIINARLDPIVGACIMAIITKSGAFSDSMYQRAVASSERFGLLR